MGEKSITKRELQTEMIALAEKSTELKKDTAKRNARKLFDKYSEIINYSKDNAEYYEKKYYRTQKMFDTLKRGVITYVKGEKTKGVILLSEIEAVEVGEKDVKLTMKNGKEITMGESFEYVSELI